VRLQRSGRGPAAAARVAEIQVLHRRPLHRDQRVRARRPLGSGGLGASDLAAGQLPRLTGRWWWDLICWCWTAAGDGHRRGDAMRLDPTRRNGLCICMIGGPERQTRKNREIKRAP
jgi:hypothetical protein